MFCLTKIDIFSKLVSQLGLALRGKYDCQSTSCCDCEQGVLDHSAQERPNDTMSCILLSERSADSTFLATARALLAALLLIIFCDAC